MTLSPYAGKLPPASMLVDVPRLVVAYYDEVPDARIPAERVIFGTSGHRGSSLRRGFNEVHIFAITQAICDYRRHAAIDGPLFLGIDTHALSAPARVTALRVLAANRVDVMLAVGNEYTPTPVVSHAILRYNRERDKRRADGIVVTPSHNPPSDGGFKYNGPDGGPASGEVTAWIEARANALMLGELADVHKVPYARARIASTVHPYDYLSNYVADLASVVDLDVIRGEKLHLGVDPLGGAGVHYWGPIAERYGLDLTVISDEVDPTFRFMTVDWDGQIRMDPSSPYAMHRLLDLKDRFDVAFACDTDHDRHGIVTKGAGLIPPNHYLAASSSYLFQHRPAWGRAAGIGKTVVTTQMMDRVASALGVPLFETPVGFKWFSEGLLYGSLGFAGEESAGASLLRMDGRAWTTDKDGIALALLAAEITARTRRDPSEVYLALTRSLGECVEQRAQAPANAAQRARLSRLSPSDVSVSELAGEKIVATLTRAPGNDAPIGGLKVITKSGWFAARPSGTEDIYKIYAESFRGQEHLRKILEEAQAIVDRALTPDASREDVPKEAHEDASP